MSDYLQSKKNGKRQIGGMNRINLPLSGLANTGL
ncbi:MAG: hypothetical protein ACI85O_003466 [Saprospiraceae bacterium]|jgi:hypothetical protein